MAEYIEREAAIDACFYGWNNNAHDCAENIRSIPAADVRPVKRGKWIKVRSHDGGVWKSIACSNCKYEPWFSSAEPLYNYCPNCGAWMGES